MGTNDRFQLRYELLNCDTEEIMCVVAMKTVTLDEVRANAQRLEAKYNDDDFTGAETPFLFVKYEIYSAGNYELVESKVVKEIDMSDKTERVSYS